MIYASPEFVFLFLPTVLIAYYLCSCFFGNRTAWAFIVLSSVFYYAYWRLEHTFILVAVLLANFAIGKAIILSETAGYRKTKKAFLGAGIAANLANIGYFKYSLLIVDSFETVSGHNFNFEQVILPIGISFYTFQAIAFLVDSYKGYVKKIEFLDFCLFLTFFPQLIAGPIVHHGEMIPQFKRCDSTKLSGENFALGLSVFSIGLLKKLVIADNCGAISDPIFAGYADMSLSDPVQAWIGALSYTFQIYFDFSAYSDMAVGLALFFNIKLPLNFFSPYKSASIIEFWRRWHMTLSRFLRDYLYIPLGGNRKGTTRRYTNLMLTMCLGGLWHGAQWQFLFWGAMHGTMLTLNHVWRRLVPMPRNRAVRRLTYLCGGIVTFVFIVTAWVPFRAENLDVALRMIGVMYSGPTLEGLRSFYAAQAHSVLVFFHGLSMIARDYSGPPGPAFPKLDFTLVWLGSVGLIVFLMPNLYQLMPKNKLTITQFDQGSSSCGGNWLVWKPSTSWAVVCGVSLVLAVTHMIGSISPFIYFAF